MKAIFMQIPPTRDTFVSNSKSTNSQKVLLNNLTCSKTCPSNHLKRPFLAKINFLSQREKCFEDEGEWCYVEASISFGRQPHRMVNWRGFITQGITSGKLDASSKLLSAALWFPGFTLWTRLISFLLLDRVGENTTTRYIQCVDWFVGRDQWRNFRTRWGRLVQRTPRCTRGTTTPRPESPTAPTAESTDKITDINQKATTKETSIGNKGFANKLKCGLFYRVEHQVASPAVKPYVMLSWISDTRYIHVKVCMQNGAPKESKRKINLVRGLTFLRGKEIFIARSNEQNCSTGAFVCGVKENWDCAGISIPRKSLISGNCCAF